MESDSEDDSDYVPPKEPVDPDVSDNEAPAPKRARTDLPASSEVPSSDGTGKTEQTGDEAYAAFKASLNAPSPQTPPVPAVQKTVKIVKRYRYAGEEITEVREVPADSQEAKQWPLWKPSDDTSPGATDAPEQPSTSQSQTVAPATSSSSTASPSGASATSAKPPAKRPGPRKPKMTLAPIPKKEPVKKLTTLDKSAMDWRAHVEGEAASGVKDELEAHRRGGGYLEKVEFLQRVEARKEEVLDANKGKRRR
ncbi:bucentaur or craniofacial development-domain-containing protein [Trametes punicea]|nr:bucentaur or craniofacial development-domain-containing protein [Trametes punicea]